MASTEYNRRHYGIVADEQPQARATAPANIARRTGAITGIYESASNPVPVNADEPQSPPLISLIPQQVEEWAIDPWKKGAASGERLISPVAVMPVRKNANLTLVAE